MINRFNFSRCDSHVSFISPTEDQVYVTYIYVCVRAREVNVSSVFLLHIRACLRHQRCGTCCEQNMSQSHCGLQSAQLQTSPSSSSILWTARSVSPLIVLLPLLWLLMHVFLLCVKVQNLWLQANTHTHVCNPALTHARVHRPHTPAK